MGTQEWISLITLFFQALIAPIILFLFNRKANISIEVVKSAIKHSSDIETKKYELKYNACISALKMVDASISNSIVKNNGNDVSLPEFCKQKFSIEQIRDSHNHLILTVSNKNIVDLYAAIMLPENGEPVIQHLEKLRAAIRVELGFGEYQSDETNRNWIGKSPATAEK